MKKKLPLPAECGEKNSQCYQQNAVKKKFTATSRMRWKFFFTAEIANLTNYHRANLNAYLIFTGNIHEVRSGIRYCWIAGGERLEPLYGIFFFVRNLVNAVKKIFSLLKIANSPHSTLKDAGALRWKKFFHRYSPLILHYFGQTSTRA